MQLDGSILLNLLILYKIFKDAAIALGLYADDTEWHNCLIEAGKVITNIENIRNLFVQIILNCGPKDIKFLWEKNKITSGRHHS